MSDTVGPALHAALWRHFGQLRYARKRLARMSGASPDTCKKWLSGESTPSLAHTIELMAQCDAVRDEIMGLVERARRNR